MGALAITGVPKLFAWISLFLAVDLSSTAFTGHIAIDKSAMKQCARLYGVPSAAFDRNDSTKLMMVRIAQIDEWTVLRSGAVRGISKNHPTIEDGDDITTSPIVDRNAAVEFGFVTTKSGSRYKLGVALPVPGSEKKGTPAGAVKTPNASGPAISIVSPRSAKNVVASRPAKKVTTSKSGRETPEDASMQSGKGLFSVFGGRTDYNGKAQEEMNAVKSSAVEKPPSKKFELTGKSIGNGKYLLVGKPRRSTSGKSQIWKAYRSDKNGLPTANVLTVKLSANFEAMEQENKNYNKVASGLFSGSFVKKLEFLPNAEGSGLGSDNLCALVIESGTMDLKELLAARGGRGLKGKAMRDAAAAAGQCIQAMHASSMVWTDLKTENFVVVSDSDGENGLPGVRGIDLESARPYKSNPVDYSPEACPPEFARQYLAGNGAEFVLGPTYDMWSLGMMLYELSTGQPYFFRQSPSKITTALRREDFAPDVSKVEDRKLRNLLAKCLSRDPKARPSITQFLLHPYFTTTGLGPFSF